MKYKILTLLSLLTILNFSGIAFSQEKKFILELEKEADEAYNEFEYGIALNKYQKLVEEDTKNIKYSYMVGICMLYSDDDLEEAIKIFDQVLEKKEIESRHYFYIGRCYMLLHKFDKAKEYFKKYEDAAQDHIEQLKEAKRYFQMCINAVELMNKPVNVTFENLGQKINSSQNDITPFVPEDESFIVFTSDKKFDVEYGVHVENIYMSIPESDEWSFAKSLSRINSYNNEHVLGLSPDGSMMLISNNLESDYSDIYLLKKRGKNFKYDKENKLFKNIKTKALETGATINNAEDVIYFSSNREGTMGGGDIFVIRKKPNGKWGEPLNVGDVINTEYDESFPTLTSDGKKMYFASKGHNSMGGYDLFSSTWDETTNNWAKPQNIGYPINTVYDDKTISFTKNQKYIYISTNSKGGYGGMDIYRCSFNDEDISYVLVKVNLFVGDKKINVKAVTEEMNISILEKDGNVFGAYKPNQTKSSFTALLPPGEFTIKIKSNLYESYIEKVVINKINKINQTESIINRVIYLNKK